MILFLITLFFIQTPYFFTAFPVITAMTDYVRAAVLVILVFCMIVLAGDLRSLLQDNLLMLGCIGWGLVLFISMKINGSSVRYAMWNVFAASLIIVLLIAVFSKVNLRKYLFVLFLYFLVINTLNNASVMFFRNTGIWMAGYKDMDVEYVFFSHVNNGLVCGLNSILAGCIYSRKYDRSWEIVNIVNLLYSLCTAVAVRSVTQIVVYCILAAVMIICHLYDRFPGIGRFLRWIDLKIMMILNCLVFFAVIVLGKTGWMEMIGINSRVHGRRELWDTVLKSILDHPVIGRGYTSWINAVLISGKTQTFWHQHSIYLQILYETGLVGAAVFLFLFIVCIIQVGKIRQFDLRFLISVMVGVFFLGMTIEITTRPEIFLLLSLCYYLPRYLNRIPETDK